MSELSDLIDEEIVQEVYDEFLDLTRDTESILLQLESDLDNMELIREIFRPFHTIKGNAGLIGDSLLQEFTQEIENILDEVRNGERSLTQEMINIALKANDLIRKIAVKHQSKGFENQISDLRTQLSQMKDTVSVVPQQNIHSAHLSIEKQKALSILKQLLKMQTILDKMKRERVYQEYLFDFFDVLMQLSNYFENKPEFLAIEKDLHFLEQYLGVLSNDDLTFSQTSYQLLFNLYSDIFSSLYLPLLTALKIKIFYWNDNEKMKKVKTYIDFFSEHKFILIINKTTIPTKNDLQELLDIHNEYGKRIAYLIRLSHRANTWKNVQLLSDFKFELYSSFSKAIESILN